ncbi:phosphoribosylanthranilate isomerase [Stagnihabitans tardus]|uniref:N-(5'-phosphoribosyl)anthranilate isomerase n=1 Tax=Stagnihabitans tardus TaxID=2699202 RepID=A0AAE4YEK4_9RHOB|nr:phosphoribosylanthranilate isomerase [Stagnihabitans tardus]NBZ88465.1 phosphoribosylanthranilate isomerase [Stagnihabitans tardus]
MIRVKICGLKTLADVQAVAAAGAAYAGFNFFPKSPRYVTPAQARELALEAPVGLAKVALVVDATDDLLDTLVETVPLDMLQLHGHESPERVAEVRARYGLPVMKVLGVAGEEDLAQILDHSVVADQLLIDAKAPKGAVLPGGNGVSFDWRLIAGRRWLRPWMLAGGLTPDNVAEAIRLTGASQVDVASGVESAPGQKDALRIAAFVRAAAEAAPKPKPAFVMPS